MQEQAGVRAPAQVEGRRGLPVDVPPARAHPVDTGHGGPQALCRLTHGGHSDEAPGHAAPGADDEEVANGQYCNLALVNHTDSEFVLDFLYVQPQQPLARVRSRIITSPRHVKRLLKALQENVQRYEARFGPITLGEDEGPKH